MNNKKYTVKYSSTFINQFNNILKYFANKLKNKIAAENFYNNVIKEIEKRKLNPLSYEKYYSLLKRNHIFYKIYVKNYTILYTVKNDTIILTKILHNKQNFKKLI